MWLLKFIFTMACVWMDVRAMSQSFVNSSSPIRPTFVVNFDISSVICQSSANRDDLKIFPISVLCDGKKDCFSSPGMDDESFPYCSNKCKTSCGEHGTCLMDGGRSLCYCNDGYSGKKCDTTDINECANKPCHWLARCTNTFGSYYCTCLPGFEGDGHNCTDIDECATPTVTLHCPENGKCCNIPGSYFCNCTDGFAPQGSPIKACVDIDECAEDIAHCENGTTCVNTVGSFKCVAKKCPDGFEDQNGHCVDIDECKKPNVCDQRAQCVNSDGSYHCTCSHGFTGDGKTCTPMADCSQQPSICHRHAFCVKELKMCLCQTGFIGDGVNCYDMNECSTDPPVCKSAEKCLNLEGSFVCCPAEQNFDECKKTKGLTCKSPCAVNAECRRGDCVCKDGFIGDPIKGCTDRNECELNSTICPSSHWCVNLDGSYMCCNDNAPLTMCRGLLVGVAPEINEIRPNVTSLNISTLGGASTEQASSVTQTPLSQIKNQTDHSSSSIGTSATKEPSGSATQASATSPATKEITSGSSIHVTKESSGSSLNTQEAIGSTSAAHSTMSSGTVAHESSTTSGVPLSAHSTDSASGVTKDSLSSTVTKLNQIGSSISTSHIEGSSLSTELLEHTSTVFPKASTSVPCSEERLKFCQTRNMSCSIINNESRCHGCSVGFVENEHGICVEGSSSKVDDCAHAVDCDDNAKCIDVKPAGHLCVCKLGFIGDGRRCDDVDECYTPNVCSPNAFCNNTIGSYNCTCNPGFVGDGRFCSEVLPGGPSGCAEHPNRCHEYAKCVKDYCQCIAGYTGNGTYCTKSSSLINVTDCTDNSKLCDPNAECVERHCQCRIGYLGDGILCRPDPEDCHLNLSLCAPDSRCIARRCTKITDCSVNSSICHADADCIEKTCQCRKGFSGSGTSCSSLLITSATVLPGGGTDGCTANAVICHRNAKCVQDQCLCEAGFVGNGRSCIPDPNDCQAYPSICHADAECVSKMKCKCKAGFIGDGRTSCVPIPAEQNCQLTPQLCHRFAMCNNSQCVCIKGYVGNGLSCLINTTDCSIAPSACHELATCINSKCQCNKGYSGDGLSCVIDLENCATGGAVCDINANCVESHCKCKEGFTGSGIICTPVGLRSCKLNASLCDIEANCIDGKCICKPGFTGNGFLCRKDSPFDCSINPGLCHVNASCIQGVCTCHANFVGNGSSCVDLSHVSGTPVSSTPISTSHESKSTPSISLTTLKEAAGKPKCSNSTTSQCDKNAECVVENGQEECHCFHGFSGDGKSCTDINECSLRMAQCHVNASCVNTMGSFMCLCPQGQRGDGVNSCAPFTKETEEIDVQCERDGMTLVLYNRNEFTGKIFVKSQSQNDRCSRNYTIADGPVYKFTASFAFCDVRMEDHNTFSTVVVIQKHPLFVTEGDEAYNLRCTYPAGELMLMSHFNVSMLSTVDTLSRNGPPPQCSLLVISGNGESVAEAIVGQKLQLRLSVEPAATYGVIAKNCVALNMESGDAYKLTDSSGCAVDPSIFPEWEQQNKSQVFAHFLTFKWPDTAQIRFQCDCSPCFDLCEPVKCQKGEKLAYGRKKRFADQRTDSQVYTHVLQVRDSDKLLDVDDDSTNELKTWSESDRRGFVYSSNGEQDLCINSAIFAAALGLAASFAAIITAAGVCTWQHREGDKLDRKRALSSFDPHHQFSNKDQPKLSTTYQSNVHKRSLNSGYTDSYSYLGK